MKIAVIGAGAWGTALAIAFARCPAHRVTLWARDAGLCATMQAARENERYLPGNVFPEALNVCADFAAAVVAVDLVLVATPLAGLRPTLRQLRASGATAPFLWLCKGLEAGSGLLPHQVAAEEMTGLAIPHGALTGPSFAEEVARALPTAVTLASADAAFARGMTHELSGPRLRIYANEDVIGAEVGGAVKNVLAIASGISDGLGLGHRRHRRRQHRQHSGCHAAHALPHPATGTTRTAGSACAADGRSADGRLRRAHRHRHPGRRHTTVRPGL